MDQNIEEMIARQEAHLITIERKLFDLEVTYQDGLMDLRDMKTARRAEVTGAAA